VKQENLPALRQSLQKTSAEGTSLPTATDADADADGKAHVQEIVAAATELTDGKQATG
jgi:hypothetical protein